MMPADFARLAPRRPTVPNAGDHIDAYRRIATTAGRTDAGRPGLPHALGVCL
jgi:hypothetical protein